MPIDTATLVIFCKRPTHYQGKQRLAATMGAESAFAVAKALLLCALEDAKIWQGQVVIAISNKQDAIWAHKLLERRHIVIVQPEGNLGDRINSIDKQLRTLGHEKLLFIGSDAPMLTPAHYASACCSLEHNDIVLSRASDGGVVIMANSCPWPNLHKLPWSTDTLADSLEHCCYQAKLEVKYIKDGFDIDTEKDLPRLVKSLACDTRPARQQLLNLLQQISLPTKVKVVLKEGKTYY